MHYPFTAPAVIPETIYCACRVEKIDDQAAAEALIRDQYAHIRQQMGITGGTHE